MKTLNFLVLAGILSQVACGNSPATTGSGPTTYDSFIETQKQCEARWTAAVTSPKLKSVQEYTYTWYSEYLDTPVSKQSIDRSTESVVNEIFEVNPQSVGIKQLTYYGANKSNAPSVSFKTLNKKDFLNACQTGGESFDLLQKGNASDVNEKTDETIEIAAGKFQAVHLKSFGKSPFDGGLGGYEKYDVWFSKDRALPIVLKIEHSYTYTINVNHEGNRQALSHSNWELKSIGNQ